MNALDELIAAGGDIHRYFTDAEIDAARDFNYPGLYQGWFDLALYWSALAFTLLLGWNRKLLEACDRAATRWRARFGPAEGLGKVMDRVWKGPGWLASVLFILAFLGISTALNVPETIYYGFFREKSQGLTNQTLVGFVGDMLLGIAITTTALTACYFTMFALMRWLGNKWWWVLGVSVTLTMLATAGRFDGAKARLLYETHELEPGPLRDAITALMAKAQVEYGKIIVINSSSRTNRSNAYVAGDGPSREIVIFDTMIKNFSNDEIAVAVAHEVGHTREPVQSRSVVAAVCLVPLLLFFHLLLGFGARSGRLGFSDAASVAAIPLLVLSWSVLTFGARRVTNTYQRERESDADYYALQLTQDPEHLRTLMVKLNKENIVDPIPPLWYEFIYSDHPAVARRLAMAYRFEKNPATAR